jgi:hypothetical protein
MQDNSDFDSRQPLKLYPKQEEAMAACRPGRRNIVLFSGPRKSSKSVVSLCALCERAWELRRRNICIVSITQSTGTDSGIWTVLIDDIMPAYMKDYTPSMEWVSRPHNAGTTKIPTFSVRNKYGGVSTFQHRSLKLEDEVEDRFKGPQFTDIFVNELSKFKKVKTFMTLHACLRGFGVPEEEILFLADTNPPDEGTDSWFYKLFYELPAKDSEEMEDWEKPLRDKIKLIEFSVDDNLAMTPEQKQILFSSLALKGEDMVQRYYWGRYVTASTDAVFANVFRPEFHVCGELETPANPDPDVLVPEDDCIELITSWDPGSSSNWAAVIAERWVSEDPRHRGRPSFKILDEHAVIGEQVDYVAFVAHMMERMEYWERVVMRESGRRVKWIHYSDQSVFLMHDLESAKQYVQLIYEASEGMIALVGVDKGAGSVRAGVELIRMLFFDDRIWINRRYCPQLVQALKSIKKGKTSNQAIDPASKFKHVCLAGGTLITTARGEVPIESVTTDDLALTRTGWQRVVASGCTDRAAEVMRMVTVAGRQVTGTRDHRILANEITMPLRLAQKGDRLISPKGADAVAVVTPILSERLPVYNLTVEGAHEYFANGILVKNCDAFRYLIQKECADELVLAVAAKMRGKRDVVPSLVWSPR